MTRNFHSRLGIRLGFVILWMFAVVISFVLSEGQSPSVSAFVVIVVVFSPLFVILLRGPQSPTVAPRVSAGPYFGVGVACSLVAVLMLSTEGIGWGVFGFLALLSFSFGCWLFRWRLRAERLGLKPRYRGWPNNR